MNDKPDRIDLNDKAKCEQWVKKLNVTHEQLREAVGSVGDSASDVEMHLKGVRSTTNDDRIDGRRQQGALALRDVVLHRHGFALAQELAHPRLQRLVRQGGPRALVQVVRP
jgi:hypothetical protein